MILVVWLFRVCWGSSFAWVVGFLGCGSLVWVLGGLRGGCVLLLGVLAGLCGVVGEQVCWRV